jgi:glucose-6-phosphate isomerase
MVLDLEPQTGLPVRLDTGACEFVTGAGLNTPSLCTRRVRDLDGVWARDAGLENPIIYRYTSALWLEGDEARWRRAAVGYGIVYFPPGVFGGEYVKSSGQYHAILAGHNSATPEIYTVLVGQGHFLLQRSKPPHDVIDDAVLVDVHAGETFIVPPDYGHLQINPANGPLVFSYTVMSPLVSDYEPYRRRGGAMYYEMAEGPERFAFNTRYPARAPLRILRASGLRQVAAVPPGADYHHILARLEDLRFLTDPAQFPESAYL